MSHKIKDLKTGYYGIYLEEWSDGYYLYSSNGCDEFLNHLPTEEEIENFIDEVTIY